MDIFRLSGVSKKTLAASPYTAYKINAPIIRNIYPMNIYTLNLKLPQTLSRFVPRL